MNFCTIQTLPLCTRKTPNPASLSTPSSVLVKNQNAYPLHLHVRKPPCKWNWIVVVGWCKWGWWHRHHIGHAQATSWWWTARWTNFLEKLPTRYRLSFDFRSQMRNYVRFLNGTYSLNQSQLGSGDLAVSEEYSRQSWFPSRWWPTIPLPGDFSLFGCFRFCLDARTQRAGNTWNRLYVCQFVWCP